MIIILNYGLGNLGSIYNMLKRIGCSAEITNDPEKVSKAEKLILPGVGQFDAGMRNLREMGLEEVLSEKVLKEKIPILGICLGMQLFMESSEEGQEKGLAWIKGKVRKFHFEKQDNLKVPHMGWNTVEIRYTNALTADFEEKMKFYFVHSYYVDPVAVEDVLLSTEYGTKFASGICRDNIFGVQFHPEKSHRFGRLLLENFAKI